jgi:hypothetical protein
MEGFMSNIIKLADFRHRSRKDFLAKHGGRLDTFVERFVSLNIDIDFRQLAHDYQANGVGPDESAWDYVHFREILSEALEKTFGDLLYRSLIEQHWFDQKLISKDEVIDRCLVTYIMSQCQYALSV